MRPVKQQWIDQPRQKYSSIHTNHSAFRLYKQQEQQYDGIDMSFDIETYINKRKFQNSFTLSDITVSSYGVKKEPVKIQSSKDTQETAEPELPIIKSQPKRSFFIYSQVEFSYKPKIKSIKKRQIFSSIFSLKQQPTLKQLKNSSTQVQVFNHQEKIKKQIKLQQLFTQVQTSAQKQRISPQRKSKKAKKRQKITEKKIKRPNKRKEKQQQNDSNKNSKKQKDQQNNLNSKLSSKQQLTTQFPFDGVLRNCQCCGKLISKLCFKCPHIYCKAENCPRKRKKLLNQKMLQKMKEQKIREHYRQRELYEKMKLQQGGTFNPKLLQFKKNQKIEQKNQERVKRLNYNRDKQKKQKKKQFQISSHEFKTSQQQFNSQIFYDFESEEQKSKPQKRIQSKNGKQYDTKNQKQSNEEKELRQEKKKYQENEKRKNKFLNRMQQNEVSEFKQQKNFNQLEKIDSFSMSLLISNEQSDQKSLEKMQKRKESRQLINKKNLEQNKQSFRFFNDYNKKSQKDEFYFDQDFDSTF